MRSYKMENETQVIDMLGHMIIEKSLDSLAVNDLFRIGLSGGSIVHYVAAALTHVKANLEKFRFFFCDERFVDEKDKESIIGTYKRTVLKKTSIKEEQFIGVNTKLSLKECAQDYEEKIVKEFRLKNGDIPKFDLLILGIGPDGHTCSLFPEHSLLKEKDHLIAAISDSPKPPPQRVTMTFPLINNAKMCVFVACGEGKADIVKRIFVDKEDLPAGMVKPLNDELHLLLDTAAGKYV